MTAYLFLYNFLSSVAWTYPLVITVLYVLNIHPSTLLPPNSPLSSWLLPLLPTYPHVRSYPTLKYAKFFPHWIMPYLYRAATVHRVVGVPTKWIQSLALLEVVHSGLGLVRSPFFTSASQVASRIVLVWGIAPRFAIVSPWKRLEGRTVLNLVGLIVRLRIIRSMRRWLLLGVSQRRSDTLIMHATSLASSLTHSYGFGMSPSSLFVILFSEPRTNPLQPDTRHSSSYIPLAPDPRPSSCSLHSRSHCTRKSRSIGRNGRMKIISEDSCSCFGGQVRLDISTLFEQEHRTLIQSAF